MVEKKYNRCACGETINKGSKQCRKCRGQSGSTANKNLPSDSKVLKMLETKSVAKVAKELGVSETTIKQIKLKYSK